MTNNVDIVCRFGMGLIDDGGCGQYVMVQWLVVVVVDNQQWDDTMTNGDVE